jgi:hypothetical protein
MPPGSSSLLPALIIDSARSLPRLLFPVVLPREGFLLAALDRSSWHRRQGAAAQAALLPFARVSGLCMGLFVSSPTLLPARNPSSTGLIRRDLGAGVEGRPLAAASPGAAESGVEDHFNACSRQEGPGGRPDRAAPPREAPAARLTGSSSHGEEGRTMRKARQAAGRPEPQRALPRRAHRRRCRRRCSGWGGGAAAPITSPAAAWRAAWRTVASHHGDQFCRGPPAVFRVRAQQAPHPTPPSRQTRTSRQTRPSTYTTCTRS